MRHSICPRLLSAFLVTAGAFINACTSTTTAPPVVVEDPRSNPTASPPAPPTFSQSATVDALGVPGGARSSTFAGASAAASVTTASSLALQTGARGMVCNIGSGLHIRVPRPLGTQNMVQSFETAWWYPRVLRWDGRQWVHYADLGWVSARLPSATPQWTVYQSRTVLQDELVAQVPDGYYAVQSWVYFEASRQWTSEWERGYEYQSPISTVPTNSFWCQVASPLRAGS